MIGKPERLVSRENIEEKRGLNYCQICGSRRDLQVHHIRTKGAGGGDEMENLVTLCAYHHRLVQDHLLNLDECELLSTRVPSYEELVQRGLECLEREQETRWTLGAICAVLTDILGIKRSDLAATFNCSVRHISNLVRTWRAFPAEGMRVPELSWQHHRLAAMTDDPPAWVAQAADNQWSTRELDAAIKAARQGGKPEDEAGMERARRALNLVNNVFQLGGASADWLRSRLSEVLVRHG